MGILGRRGGFTLLEMLISVVVFGIVLIGIYSIFGDSQSLQRKTVDRSEAQQNARNALDTIQRELRLAGYGIDGATQVPIIVASEYRVTFVRDMDSDGVVDPGETITYFLEPDASNLVSSSTPNPRDTVLRRVVSNAGNSTAAPVSGQGEIIAGALTQQIDDDGTLDIPLFIYYDADGISLVDPNSDDPYDACYGHSVPDADLGKPVGGANEIQIVTIHISVVCETEALDPRLNDYGRVVLGTTMTPRNMPLQLAHATPKP
jgi:prepilin-type N-terminal cleavage/methylation domain-containing protein